MIEGNDRSDKLFGVFEIIIVRGIARAGESEDESDNDFMILLRLGNEPPTFLSRL